MHQRRPAAPGAGSLQASTARTVRPRRAPSLTSAASTTRRASSPHAGSARTRTSSTPRRAASSAAQHSAGSSAPSPSMPTTTRSTSCQTASVGTTATGAGCGGRRNERSPRREACDAAPAPPAPTTTRSAWAAPRRWCGAAVRSHVEPVTRQLGMGGAHVGEGPLEAFVGGLRDGLRTRSTVTGGWPTQGTSQHDMISRRAPTCRRLVGGPGDGVAGARRAVEGGEHDIEHGSSMRRRRACR